MFYVTILTCCPYKDPRENSGADVAGLGTPGVGLDKSTSGCINLHKSQEFHDSLILVLTSMNY